MSVLVLQMGHVGRTTGATGAPGEQEFTRAVGAECVRLLDGREGWRVRPIGADVTLDLYRGDAFIAVHADGSTNPDVRGASVGYQTGQGNVLAQRWRAGYVRRGFSGPWNEDNYTPNLHYYYGVTNAVKVGNMRACIVEAGTITNAEDRALMDPVRVALSIGDVLGIVTDRAADEPLRRTEDVVAIITCAEPNHCGLLLPDGRMVDVTDDTICRGWAQGLINAGKVVEVRVGPTTWSKMLGPNGV